MTTLSKAEDTQSRLFCNSRSQNPGIAQGGLTAWRESCNQEHCPTRPALLVAMLRVPCTSVWPCTMCLCSSVCPCVWLLVCACPCECLDTCMRCHLGCRRNCIFQQSGKFSPFSSQSFHLPSSPTGHQWCTLPCRLPWQLPLHFFPLPHHRLLPFDQDKLENFYRAISPLAGH